MRAASATPVGRDTELGVLLEFIDAATFPRALVIEGEAGIGKTTLWLAGVDAARRQGHRVLSCRPNESEATLSFVALADLLEGALDDVLGELPSPQRHALRAALLLEDTTAQLDERAVATAAVNALRALTTRQSIVIAIDDVDWLDRATQSIVAFAARRVGDRPVSFLLARRIKEEAPAPLGLERALGSDRVWRLPLEPMSLGAVHHLLVETLGLVPRRPELRRLYELSGGNPFYALELGRAVKAGAIKLDVADYLPPVLADLVDARISGLPDETITALARAAALSRPTTALVDVASLRPAVRAGVVSVLDDEVRFDHPLLRSAAYGRLGPAAKRALHRELVAIVADVEERARHLALSAEIPDETIAAQVEEGANAAYRRGAPAAGAELAAHARRLTPPETADAAARRLLAEAEYRFEAGDPSAAAILLEEAISAQPAGATRARMLALLARVRQFADGASVGVEILQRALEEPGGDAHLRAGIEEGLAWGLVMLRGDLERAARHARSAVRSSVETGDRTALAEALAAQGLTETLLGLDGSEAMGRALALEDATWGVRVLRRPSFAHAYVSSRSDDLVGAQAILQDLYGQAQERGDESALGPILGHLAEVECRAGNWARALEHLDEADVIALQIGQRPTRVYLMSVRAFVEAHRGRVDEARRAGRVAIELTGRQRPEDVFARGGEFAHRGLGLLELSLGNFEASHEMLGPLTQTLLRAGVGDPGEIACLPDDAEALIALNGLEEAERLIGRYEGMAHATGRTSAIAVSARCRGLLLAVRGDAAGALTTLERAVQTPIAFDRARALLALGRQRRRTGQKRLARRALEDSLEQFETLGAAVFALLAKGELARIGGRERSGEALTPTERRLAALVAEGRSNKDVAAALFVTPKTVETTLSRIYAKLGIHSRAELMRSVLDREDPIEAEPPGKL